MPRHENPRHIYADEKMIPAIKHDDSLSQVTNVACLPGIVGPSMAMPDIHCGYGFPIGGVAAFDMNEGIVSPGGVGYDINCGVRLFKTGLQKEDISEHLKTLVDGLFLNIPSGIGSKRKDLKLSNKELEKVLEYGASWAVKKGFGSQNDILHIEDHMEKLKKQTPPWFLKKPIKEDSRSSAPWVPATTLLKSLLSMKYMMRKQQLSWD